MAFDYTDDYTDPLAPFACGHEIYSGKRCDISWCIKDRWRPTTTPVSIAGNKMIDNDPTLTLYKAVNCMEHSFIKQSGYTKLSLLDKSIIFTTSDEEHAISIAKNYSIGFVIKYKIKKSYTEKLDRTQVRNIDRSIFFISPRDISYFNYGIIGKIEVIHKFHQPKKVKETIDLYFAFGAAEYLLLYKNNFKQLPLRKDNNLHTLYVVENRSYSMNTAQNYYANLPETNYTGFVAQITIKKSLLEKCRAKVVDNPIHRGYWVFDENIELFNKEVNNITITDTFHGKPAVDDDCLY